MIITLRSEGVEGYTERFCKVCQKETTHFIFEGDGCKAYICRNQYSHKLTQQQLPESTQLDLPFARQ